MTNLYHPWIFLGLAISTAAFAQTASQPSQLAAGLSCEPVTQAHADASAGTPNVSADGSPLPGVTAPDISKGFQGIPRSAQPALTLSQRRILECTYHLAEANADIPYTLFVPSAYKQGVPAPLIVDLHGLNITPLMQILFDGTADFAERYGFIVLCPMGYSVAGWWGARPGAVVETAATKPGGTSKYTVGELSEIDAMTVLNTVRQKFSIDNDRVFLMGHSMGGGGTWYLGSKYNDIWAGIAPISGLGGIPDDAGALRYRKFATLILHGEKDSIVNPNFSRHAAMELQTVGAQHIYLEVPGKDHEFWIRRGRENMEKVFLFFAMLSKKTNVGFMTPEKAPLPALPAGRGPGR